MNPIEKLHGFKKSLRRTWRTYFSVDGLDKCILPDEIYIKNLYYQRTGKNLDLDNPKTLCEKLNWLKLNYRKPEYTSMVDKYLAKQYVDSIIGEGHTIPTLGVWDSFDQIDFSTLPNSFVLKCTHDSGSAKIIKDKSTINYDELRNHFKNCLSRNYYKKLREWPYKNVKRRIIAEPIIEYLGKRDSIEYKTTCFNGKVGFVTICTGIAHSTYEDRNNDHFDKEFNKLDWYVHYKPAKETPKKPEKWDEIIEFSEKLASGVPYLRVDTYVIDGKILFGEMTFYTWGGFMEFEPPEWDRKLGDMLILPKEKVK